MRDLLKDLNSDQLQAVTHKNGPLLIIAGAGTGKTTVITHRIAWLIEQKLAKPEEILALTFTEKAAAEMEQRVDVLVPYGFVDTWISTFHAFGDRILRDHSLDLGLPANYKILTKTEQAIFFRQNIYAFDLKYFRPIANPLTHIDNLLTHFSRLKDELISPSEYIRLAQDQKSKIKDQKNNKEDQIEVEKTLELANAYQRYQDLMIQAGNLDYGDLIFLTYKLFKENPKVLQEYQQKFKYILVDEFQDTNFAQNEIVKLLSGRPRPQRLASSSCVAGVDQNITVVGDDDQCLLPTTRIKTTKGDKFIKNLKINQEIITAVGKGHVGISKINKIFKNTKMRRLITIKTASNKKLSVTDNHKMFSYVPDKENNNFYYVYLMYRQNLGWRLGITNDLITRLRLERSADKIIGLKAYKREVEARYWEVLWALQYSLPTGCFKERKNIAIKGAWLKKLYQQIDTEKNARRLASDLGIDLDVHHFCLDAVTRGQSRRIKINVNICQRNYRSKHGNNLLFNPKVVHEINLETSNQKIIKLLKDNGYQLQKSKKGYRIRIQKTDASEISKIVFNLQKLTKGIVENKFKIGFKNKKTHAALVMPASNILEGHYLPIIRNNKIIYDEIISKKISYKKVTTYDLEINRTHNFIANDVVVHNSIYRFRGASIANILQFNHDYQNIKQIVLNKNYRSTQEILDASHKLIHHNDPERLEIKNKIDKSLISKVHGPKPELLHCDLLSSEVATVVAKIKELKKKFQYDYKDFAILVRANNHANSFIQSLNSQNIPYIFSGASSLFEEKEVKMLISFLRCLINQDDHLSFFNLATSELYNLPTDLMTKYYHEAKISHRGLEEIIKNDSKMEKILLDLYNNRLKIGNFEVGELLYDYLKDSGYLKKLSTNPTIENEIKMQNIARFFQRISQFNHSSNDKGIMAFLENLELILEVGEEYQTSDIDPDLDAINILTIHAAKGLEWPIVFVVNMVADRFPSRQRSEQLPIPDELIKEKLPQGNFHLQEERRLFYVAVTRAKKLLYLTSADDYGGKRQKKISQFVMELLDEPQKEKLKIKLSALEQIEKFKKTSIDLSNNMKLKSDKQGILRLSRQQIDDYFTCPKKYYFAHEIKIPLLENQYLMYGTAIHAALDHYFARKIRREKLTLTQLLDDYNNAFKNVGFITREHEELRKKQGLETLTSFFDKDQKSNLIPYEVEIPFEFKEKDIKIRGRYDLIYQINNVSDQRKSAPEFKNPRLSASYEICDFKTSEVKDQKDADRRIRESTQMMIYALSWQKKYGIIPKTTLYFIESGLKGEKVFSQKELDQTRGMIQKVASGIRTNNFRAAPDRFNCSYCPYKDICADKYQNR